ncbi:MAG: DUF5615 family PIN-like protein [Nodosilinea sp. WJT8-NPBG4]|jgi:predicted nuclease of predicted toxin-antitoxin system|nr:DUF5615 family PIN-like protein [Nodosilinea sp. WJT8-NPBG4]
MARFYSNENLPIDLVEALRQLNHDVLTSYEAGRANQNIPDQEVLAFATADRRCVVTLNRQDFIALHRSGTAHSGIIICKEDRDYQGQAQTLHSYVETSGQDLSDRLIRIQKQNQPKAKAQVFVAKVYSR